MALNNGQDGSVAGANGRTKPPDGNEARSRKPVVSPSFYNSRLAPIRGGPVPKMAYHGSFQGVPLVSAKAAATRPPPSSMKAKSSDTNLPPSSTKPNSSDVDLSSLPVPRSNRDRKSMPFPAAADEASAYVSDRPATSAQMTNSGDRCRRPATQSGSSGSSRSGTNIGATAQSVQRPRTSAQTMQTRPHSEWRDIHVKSLNRVDSILREAVGLGQTGANRWTVYAPAENSGLGISMQQPGSYSELKQRPGPCRPGTAHAHFGSQRRGQMGESTLDLLQPFAPAVGQRMGSDAAGTPARPSTSSARLGRAGLVGLDGQYGEHGGSVVGSRPTRMHDGVGGNRVASMYIPSQRTVATHEVRRQVSMYYPSCRPIQLSRDEARRSRLFAEYEQLVAPKDSDEGADDDEDDDDDDDDGPDSPTGGQGSGKAQGIPFARGPSRGLEDISEEVEEAFSSFEDVIDTLRSSSEDPRGKRASVYVDRARPTTAQPGGSSDTWRQQERGARTMSMYAKADLFSKQQTEQRWSRMINQNQHLFTAHASMGPGEQEQQQIAARKEDDEQDRAGNDAQSLVLELPHTVDLFQDVTQALAERMPPHSAGSTGSASSASTLGLGSQPLSAMPRVQSASSQPAEPARQQGSSAAGKDNKRESIYIDAESLFNSALFADEDLPYQSEGRTVAVDEPATAYTPTIAAKSLPDDPAFAKLSVETKVQPNASGSEAEELGGLDAEEPDGELEQTDTETPGPARAVRHSSQVREQLRLMEGSTPAAALGAELSKNDREHRELLEAYMQRFDFGEQPIDFALRQLFGELRLPAESQQIDRVISSFARRYDACNAGLFGSADVVYAYAFAILLLHTDAHNPRVRHKMSKAQFTAHAKLLDDSEQCGMFDEVLDIVYDNVTMVKFEYAPGGGGDVLAALEAPAREQQSPGISGWLRRMFAPASAGRAPLSPQDVPPKQQYSYASVGRRRGGSSAGLAGSAPASVGLRPSTAHGTCLRSSVSSSSGPGLPRGRANTSGPPASTPALTPIATSFSQPCASAGGAARPFRSSPLAGRGPACGSPDADARAPDSPSLSDVAAAGLAPADPTAAPQPVAVESIRLRGVKSHVKRRVSLQRGRPLSGIIYQSPPPQAEPARPATSGGSPLDGSGNALLRVDMAGHVSRKMERRDHGRRGLVRRWKGLWMVLSGSRLYMFRAGAGGQAAMAVQTIVSLRNGVAVADAAYTKYAHVFRILADDGSEMLVRAADDDAVAEWMARINCAAAFKSVDIERRAPGPASPGAASPGARALQLERCLETLDSRLRAIDDRLERCLRLFKQLASLVPLTRQARARTVQH
ncbi:hypothetical protein IWW52_003650, partial [Coemansia sp. RSA 2704]